MKLLQLTETQKNLFRIGKGYHALKPEVRVKLLDHIIEWARKQRRESMKEFIINLRK